MIQKRVTILLGSVFVLWLPFSGFAGDEKPGSPPITNHKDVFKIDPFAFHLALAEQGLLDIVPLFTIMNHHRHVRSRYDPYLYEKAKMKPQILEKVTEKSNRVESSLFTATLVTFAALNIADYLTTLKALHLPGLEEGNPFMRPFTKNIYLFSAVKLGITALDFYLLKSIHRKNKTLGWILSIGSNLAMSYIVSYNLRKIQSVPRE